MRCSTNSSRHCPRTKNGRRFKYTLPGRSPGFRAPELQSSVGGRKPGCEPGPRGFKHRALSSPGSRLFASLRPGNVKRPIYPEHRRCRLQVGARGSAALFLNPISVELQMRRGAPRSSSVGYAPSLSYSAKSRLHSARPHTGDFEELRNFGMCWTGKGAVIVASGEGKPDRLEQVPKLRDARRPARVRRS